MSLYCYAVTKELVIGPTRPTADIAIRQFLSMEMKHGDLKKWEEFEADGYQCLCFEMLEVGRVNQAGFFMDEVTP